MGLIIEEIKHPTLRGVELMVDKKQRDEVSDYKYTVGLEIDYFEIETPSQLIELGTWLVSEGSRIKKKYKLSY